MLRFAEKVARLPHLGVGISAEPDSARTGTDEGATTVQYNSRFGTHRFQGREFRLTDVHGSIVRPILQGG